MSFTDAAVKVLTEAGGPLHYKELCRRILDQGLVTTAGGTPDATLNSVLAVEIKRKGQHSRFIRTKPGVFALQGAGLTQEKTDGTAAGDEEDKLHVRIPLYPKHAEVRLLVPIWEGRLQSDVTGLRSTIVGLTGTPKNPVDWSKPDEWIEERLQGRDRDLANAIWQGSKQEVSPRHIYGHWLLIRRYCLMDSDSEGVLQITPRGRDFLEHMNGDVEAEIDEMEGLLKALSIVSDKGPANTVGNCFGAVRLDRLPLRA